MVVTKGRYDVTSPGRDVGRFGRWVAEYRRNHGGFTVEIVDLAEVALPVLDEPQHPRRARTRRNARGTSRDHRSGVRLHPGAARVQLRVYRAGEERPRLRCSRCAACVPQVGLVSPLSCLVRTDPGHRPRRTRREETMKQSPAAPSSPSASSLRPSSCGLGLPKILRGRSRSKGTREPPRRSPGDSLCVTCRDTGTVASWDLQSSKSPVPQGLWAVEVPTTTLGARPASLQSARSPSL